MEVLKNSEERYLRYDYKAEEIYDISNQLANRVQERQTVEAQKKSAAAQFKGQIDILTASIGDLSNKVASGYETRRVDCKVRYHYPEQGYKQITRTDTNEVLPKEKMTSEEWNLFNQEQTDDSKKVERSAA